MPRLDSDDAFLIERFAGMDFSDNKTKDAVGLKLQQGEFALTE